MDLENGTSSDSAQDNGQGSSAQESSTGQSGIPRERFNQVVDERNALRRERDELKGGQQAASPQETVYTRSQLNGFVAKEELTQDQAEEIWANQISRSAEKKAEDKATQIVVDGQKQTAVNTAISRYLNVIPDLKDEASGAFQKVQEKYNWLVSIGQPDTTATQVAAMDAAFGSIDALEAAGTAKPRDTHQDTGGGDRPGQDDDTTSEGWDKNMNAGQRNYYQDMVNKGVYKTTADANKQFSYKGKHNPRHAR
ncbi:MAG: hypothetical protein GY906_24345 [bacterium]|nr:hypothetical protein [bacterium]